jgi:hypothetical protein
MRYFVQHALNRIHSDIPLLKWQLLTNETKYFKELENVEWWILLLSSLMVVRTRVSEESRGLHCLPFRGAFFQSQILVGIVAGIVALSKDVTDYGPRLYFPYYNVTIRHREGSPYPKLVTCDRYVGLKNLKKGNGIQNTTQKTLPVLHNLPSNFTYFVTVRSISSRVYCQCSLL